HDLARALQNREWIALSNSGSGARGTSSEDSLRRPGRRRVPLHESSASAGPGDSFPGETRESDAEVTPWSPPRIRFRGGHGSRLERQVRLPTPPRSAGPPRRSFSGPPWWRRKAMALTILADPCAGCGVCGEVCPMSAIHRLDRGTPEIDPARCTECVGHFASPRCASLCRLEAI